MAIATRKPSRTLLTAGIGAALVALLSGQPAGAQALPQRVHSAGAKPLTFSRVTDCFKDSGSKKKLFEQNQCLYGAEWEAARKAKLAAPTPIQRERNYSYEAEQEARRRANSDYFQAATSVIIPLL